MIKTCLALTSLFSILCFTFPPGSLAAELPKSLSEVKRITLAELQQMQAREPVIIIDTRAPGQWMQAKDKVPGAIRVTSGDDLVKLKKEIPADHAVVTYCT